MKKKVLLSILFCAILLALGCTISSAANYSTDAFTATIPNSYETETFYNKIETKKKSGRNTVASISISATYDTTQTGRDEAFLEGAIQYFQNEYRYNSFQLISKKVLTTNGCKGVEFQFRNTYTGTYLYSDVYSYESDNYDYNIVIVTDTRSYLSSAEKNNIIKSFKIKDTVTKSRGIPFIDVPDGEWYFNTVKYVSDKGIIKGSNAYTFSPNTNLTRGMLATILWRMEGSPKTTGGKNFSDVKNTNDFYLPIKWASSKGIVNGYANGKFGVNDNITREDLAVMLNNYAKYKGKKVTSTYNINKYKDISKVSSYAKPAVQWAVEKGIISGKESGTKLDPKGKATRAEAATMIYSYMTKIK